MNWNCSEHFEKSLIILPDKWGWNLGVPTLRFESVWVWTKDDICIFSMNFHLHRLSLLTNKKQDSSLNGKSFFWVHSNFKKELSKINFLILFWSLDFGYRSRTVSKSNWDSGKQSLTQFSVSNFELDTAGPSISTE